ncbi:PAS domain-containing protein [Methylobacterium haplocladii]|uniref:PAS domain-containing protein n=1 Tax=Methylobacterium haplocladii TaxID=1176176 RepID=UPI0011BE66AD
MSARSRCRDGAGGGRPRLDALGADRGLCRHRHRASHVDGEFPADHARLGAGTAPRGDRHRPLRDHRSPGADDRAPPASRRHHARALRRLRVSGEREAGPRPHRDPTDPRQLVVPCTPLRDAAGDGVVGALCRSRDRLAVRPAPRSVLSQGSFAPVILRSRDPGIQGRACPA